jgi:hypothetical protein
MKVNIGPYKNWIGPYQIAEKILFWKGDESDAVEKLGERLSKMPLLVRFCKWTESKRQRTIKIHIDNYDTWNMNSTLSLIVVPMLKQLKATKHGMPWTDDEDVPEHLRSTNAPPKENEWDIDALHEARWDWVLDEMIWAFEQDNAEWEEKYYSGEIDFQFEKIEGENFSRMVDGPNHTFKIDQEGIKKHYERIKNGRRLFGKYYDALWD